MSLYMIRPGTATVLGAVAWLVCSIAPMARATDSGITRVTLANGLRVVLAPDSSATAADVALWYATGARGEKPGLSGMTRLFERLMFRGSAGVRDGEHRRRIHAEGGLSNTTTTADYSCFWQTVPGEAVGVALQLEADRMAGLRPSPAALAEECRALAGDRRAVAQRAPIARGLAALYATVFNGQAYGRPLLGVEGDLARVTLRDLEAWRRERYMPANAVLTVVGRFDPTATLQRIRQSFESLPKGAAFQNPRLLAPTATRRSFQRSDAPARILFAGWRGPGASDPDAPALEVLARLLGTGDGARLPRALVSEGKVALAAQAGCNIHRDASLLWSFAVVGTDADTATAERVLLDEVGRLSREPVSEEELDSARRGLETSTLFAQQTSRGRALALGEAELLTGDAAHAAARLDALRHLTPAAVQRVAQRVLTESARGVVWLAPGGGAR